ncbi:hypothetical protein M9978_02545 [Sphingomonas sp. MG17]|uniref:Uncharacterized protein n=1 Tax=Sphingomonas tagetis TaxID=2949092 RepID=A0A9X2KKF2_9SPHN|nr:hypothetical protein [Sphingomonas tagetis]MCP3729296.1 hypothetical protein [Sphingomonas tagetis]
MSPDRKIEMAREMASLLSEDFSEMLKRRMGIAFAGGIPYSAQSAAIAMFAEGVNRVALGMGLVGIDPAARLAAATNFAAVLKQGIDRQASNPEELCSGFDLILAAAGLQR